MEIITRNNKRNFLGFNFVSDKNSLIYSINYISGIDYFDKLLSEKNYRFQRNLLKYSHIKVKLIHVENREVG